MRANLRPSSSLPYQAICRSPPSLASWTSHPLRSASFSAACASLWRWPTAMRPPAVTSWRSSTATSHCQSSAPLVRISVSGHPSVCPEDVAEQVAAMPNLHLSRMQYRSGRMQMQDGNHVIVSGNVGLSTSCLPLHQGSARRHVLPCPCARISLRADLDG